MPEKKIDVGRALVDTLISPNESDRNAEAANVVDGLFAIARGLQAVARAIDRLGNADAGTPMGGMEAHGKVTKEALEYIGSAISEGMSEIASAIGGGGQS